MIFARRRNQGREIRILNHSYPFITAEQLYFVE